MAEIRLPKSDDRTVIIGPTGSGKTQFGVFLLLSRDWYKRRWFILDFKGEQLFTQLGLTPWDISAPLPSDPGLYWIRVLPGDEALVSNFFFRCYESGNCGIYTDEGYMLPYKDRWVKTCLTQGRSKNIEMITLTQRPVLIDLFFFSEASFFSVFSLRVKDDRKRVSEFMNGLEIKALPRYHSLWYDVVNDSYTTFKPVPPAPELIAAFRDEIEEAEAEPATVEKPDTNESGIIKL